MSPRSINAPVCVYNGSLRVLDGAYSGVAIDQPLELQVVYQFPASRQVQVVAETERIGGCELQLVVPQMGEFGNPDDQGIRATASWRGCIVDYDAARRIRVPQGTDPCGASQQLCHLLEI